MTLTPEQVQEYRAKYNITPVGTSSATTGKPVNIERLRQRVEDKKRENVNPFNPFFTKDDQQLKSKGSEFTDRVSDAFSERSERGGEELFRASQGEISPVRGGLRAVGQGAGFVGDVAGEAVMSVGKTLLPKRAEEAVASGVEKVVGSEPVQSAVEAYQSFKEKHPEAAMDLEAIGNIASLLPIGEGGKVIQKGASKGLVRAGEALERSGIEAAESQSKNFIRDLVRPEQTKAVKEAQVARTTEKGVGPFKRSVIEPTQQELRIETEIAKIPDVKPSNTFQQNYNAIQKANTDEAIRLEQSVLENDFVIPRREVISRLSEIKEELRKSPILVGDAEKTADKLLAGAIDIVNKNEAKGSGLLRAKKEYDQWVLSQKPKVFDANAENAFTIANREVRNVFKDILDENAPDVGVKESLARQSALYGAMDNIAPKAAQEADTAIGRVFQRAANAVGLKNKLVQQIAAVAGIGGLGAAATFAPAAAVAGGLGLVAYQGGKLLLKPQVRELIGKFLKESGHLLEQGDRVILQNALDGKLEELKGANLEAGFAKNPFSTGEIPKELESLAKEARKYKSAEEFVKGQGETLYHGTGEGVLFDKFDISKAQRGNRGKQIHLTENKIAADWFSQLKSQTNYLATSEFKSGKTTKGLGDFTPNTIEFVVPTGAKIKLLDKLPQQSAEKVIEQLKKEGYDGVRFTDDVLNTIEGQPELAGAYKNGKHPDTVIMFDTTKLKTKSQLTDIWKKANQ